MSPGARLPVPFALVTGGKGGVGKTLLAANLGVQLAREGRRVLLVDLDLALADLHVVLRLSPRVDVEDALAGRASLRDCVLEGPGGVHLLPAGSGAGALARLEDEGRAALLEALAELAGGYELVVGDSAAGVGPDVLAFATCADLVLAATTPEPAALTDAYGLVKALDAFALAREVELPTPELVLNLVSGSAEAEQVAGRLRGVCERFLSRSPRLAGWLPRSPRVVESALQQRPFVLEAPRSLEAACLRRLGARVARLLPAAPAADSSLKAGARGGR